jgi:hypothetical protein
MSRAIEVMKEQQKQHLHKLGIVAAARKRKWYLHHQNLTPLQMEI